MLRVCCGSRLADVSAPAICPGESGRSLTGQIELWDAISYSGGIVVTVR